MQLAQRLVLGKFYFDTDKRNSTMFMYVGVGGIIHGCRQHVMRPFYDENWYLPYEKDEDGNVEFKPDKKWFVANNEVKMPNEALIGKSFKCWAETHYRISGYIHKNMDNKPSLIKIHKDEGTCGLEELAYGMTIAFENRYANEDWSQRDWMDILDIFIEEELNEI